MVALIQNNIDAIRDACKKHHVKSLYLFGSANSGQAFDQQSDIDFLYEIDIDDFKNWDTGNYDYIDNLDGLAIRSESVALQEDRPHSLQEYS